MYYKHRVKYEAQCLQFSGTVFHILLLFFNSFPAAHDEQRQHSPARFLRNFITIRRVIRMETLPPGEPFIIHLIYDTYHGISQSL